MSSSLHYIFCWLGNTDLLVSIIKLIEDKMNLEHDVNEVGVQLILLVMKMDIEALPFSYAVGWLLMLLYELPLLVRFLRSSEM